MADYHISTEESNGYVIGDNINSGASPSEPWLTLDKVRSGFTWSGNDRVYINGALVTCNADIRPQGNIEYIPVVDGVTTLLFGISVPIAYLYQNNSAGAVTTWGDFIIDCQHSTVGMFNLLQPGGNHFNNTKFINIDNYLFISSTLALTQFTGVIDSVSTSDAKALSRLILANVIDGDIDIEINGIDTEGGTSTPFIIIGDTSATITSTCKVKVNGTHTSRGTGTPQGVLINEIPVASVEDSDFTILVPNAAGVEIVIIDSQTNAAPDCKILNCNLTTDATAGISALVGADSGTTACTGGEIDNVSVTGGDSGPSTLHAPFFGGGANGKLTRIDSDYCNPGPMFKLHTGGESNGLKVRHSDGSGYARFKGAVNCKHSNFTAIIDPGYEGPAMLSNDNDGGAISTGCEFNNPDIIIMDGASPTDLVTIGSATDASDTEVNGGNIYDRNGAVDDLFNYGANTNQSLANFQAQSFVTGFTNIQGIYENEEAGDFTPAENSPLLGAGIRHWTGANPVGNNGEPFSDFDTDIGLNQSTHSPFHPGNTYMGK